MRFALFAQNFGAFYDPRLLAELAHEAEESGWDGFFLWDHMLWTDPQPQPVADPWVAMAAMAMSTSRIRLGAVITPVARRHPWKVAREALTLDHLSGGRMVLGVGIGGDWYHDYSGFGLPVDDKSHGAMLDEGLDVISGLWSGQPFSYEGEYYKINDVTFLPRPVQQPRIPIWVAGLWPHKKPFRRAARWDGAAAEGAQHDLTSGEFREISAFIKDERTAVGPFDITHKSPLPPSDQAAHVIGQYEEAGVTWWLQPIIGVNADLAKVRRVVHQGPPKGR